ncbi:MAG: HipA domain-containing protein, partial [Actinomycetes bacterium]|nr:HipA domain-containing protein [Actinomycetes bacterium]
KTLLAAGTASLGGARPKAACEIDGHLFIAKFPHPTDRWDVMRWEHLALELAEMAGITVPAHQLVEVEGSAVLLSRRFDRDERGGRIGYISAMTMLEADEGSSSDYLDIADSLTELSIAASEDLSQLYRRILFSAFIHNTDDHLRNHGLVRHNAGWRLSPAFGLNPNPDLTRRHVTTIGGVNGDMTAEVQALSHAREWFGLTEADARTISAEVAAALTQWRTQAQLSGITAGEIQLFAPVFNAGHKALK